MTVPNETVRYAFAHGAARHVVDMVLVEGTAGRPYAFGEGDARREIDVPSFWIMTTPVTQALWAHVTGDQPAVARGDRRPVENVSWDHVTASGGFLDAVAASPLRDTLAGRMGADVALRPPSESEWEYAARGGPHWTDGFRFAGSDDVDRVAWYRDNGRDHTHDVALKAPNQLGIHDMCGNVWEWCRDVHTHDVARIPADGSALVAEGGERVLRGGCFHNWAVHCTVSKRYEIGREFHDGCIGLRLVCSAA
jgi:formylglycine-generating enzyme